MLFGSNQFEKSLELNILLYIMHFSDKTIKYSPKSAI